MCLNLKETTKAASQHGILDFSKAKHFAFLLTVWEFPLSLSLSTLGFVSILTNYSHLSESAICISVITNDIEHLFICLSFEKCLFRSGNLFVCLFVLLY